ncbi:MAG: hypothetical protein JW806_08575 [Sedimentisphaerales bacterium]|nr:hypothetical protein [Sedimentisphaerales bacterium]
MRNTLAYIICLSFALVSEFAFGSPAFPGAEGFGAESLGGRGGVVYEVTNVNDSGPGSLREAIEASGPRTVVFRISGTIALQSALSINNPYITIAGQTAPGGGICIKDYPLTISADNVIIRYIRSRLGDNIEGNEWDSIGISSDSFNIILDHCSASWSVDETLSTNSTVMPASPGNVTVQWCIISESLDCSVHSKGCHGYGSIIGGSDNSGITYHHNLYAHHRARSPRPGNYNNLTVDPCGLICDFRNNLVYNWGGTYAGYNADGSNGTNSITNMNFIGNYYKRGSNSTGSYAFSETTKTSRAYFNGNWMQGAEPSDPWSLVIFSGTWSEAEKNIYKQAGPIDVAPVTTDDGSTAYSRILAHAGASLPVRDAVDKRIINDVINGTGSIIDDEDEVGGWDVLNSLPAPNDVDHDGMPDAWETANGLNINDANDRNGYDLDPAYTNLEVYLNGLIPAGTYTEDTNAPTPDPMTWEAEPDGFGVGQIRMIATTAMDPGGVQYYFANITDANHDSPWQDSAVYIDTGLTPDVNYTYQVKARDMSPGFNETGWSPQASATAPSVIVIDPPAAYWPLNETDGNTVHEVNDPALWGSLEGMPLPAWEAGRFGNCLTFDANGQRVYVPSSGAIDFGDEDFSVSLWAIQPVSFIGQYELLIKGTIGVEPFAGSGKRYELYRKDAEFRFAVDDNVTKSQLSLPETSFCTGGWVHIVAVRDTVADELRLYADGVLQGLPLTDSTGSISQSEPLYLADGVFAGAIDDVRIYDYVLNEEQINAIYNGAELSDYICVEPIVSDLDDDCQVDFFDYAILAGDWPSGMLNFDDIAAIAMDWLECNRDPVGQCWQ